jgi:8-oxo-dGTP diphosphatase
MKPDITHYCLGFLFDDEAKSVLLIRKSRPVWQAGLLNGIGGKLNKRESARVAMSREMEEEAGVGILPQFWRTFAVLEGPNFHMQCFVVRNSVAFQVATSRTEELLERRRVIDLESPEVVHNVLWLVEMARDPNSNFEATIGYLK